METPETAGKYEQQEHKEILREGSKLNKNSTSFPFLYDSDRRLTVVMGLFYVIILIFENVASI